ncbi:MAG: Rne/Rng family ribonuclease [Kofleriaceae bacterium]|nr:Rne/Rng family ribonuclease [Kofleriaceae bacterium]MBP9203514.1 Rne/Rng family ribonuclease [Kofleriaceae bacterium]
MSQNILVVNAEGSEVRVAVIEQGSLAELFVERKRERGLVGNIYRGKVTRVLPGMQAAFVDLGPKVERAAFLFVGDVLGSGDQSKLFEDADTDADTDEAPEGTAARLARSRKALANRKIEDLLRPGQEVLCQVVKDPIGQKGARVTGYLSLPGRYGVFMPAVDQVGVSKRIGSDKERKRLRDIVNSARPKGAGFIVRTAAEDAIEQEIRDDVEYLSRVWSEIGRREKELRGPGLIYADLDLALRTVRDLMREETTELLIDDEDQFERVRKFTMAFLPRFAERIKRYDNRRPIFDFYHVEPALRQAIGRKVPLRSGGSLVIDQGEALTAIDINTGSFTGKGSDLEDTVTRNNLEACEEVARQLRLRNIGGIIVVDFVDMDREENRKKVWEAFQRALKRDRARCNVTKISELGLVEMTRKRTRESLVQVLTEPCPLCEGAGVIKSTTTLAYEILREVRRSGGMAEGEQIELECAPRVADLINRSERDYLDNLEKRFHKPIVVVGQKSWRPDQYRVAGRMSTDIIAAEAAEAQVALPPPPRAASGGNGHSHAGNGGGGGGAGAGAGRGKRRRRGGRGRGRDAASA